MHLSPNFTADSCSLAAIGGGLIGLLATSRVMGRKTLLPSSTFTPFQTPILTIFGYYLLHFPSPLLNDPTSFFPPPPSSSLLLRSLLAGILIGLGSKLGSGCTSGNGIQGLASFSPASLTFVIIMMVCGSLTASITNSNLELNVEVIDSGQPKLQDCYLLILVTLLSAISQVPLAKVPILNDITSGLAFSGALTISGMVKTSKVITFLDFKSESHGFDPSLGFVMGGALLVATPVFWGLKLAERNEDIKLWKNRPINLKTVVGGGLFGVGWGLGGICPGPGLTTAAMSTVGGVWVAGMFGARGVLGMLQEKKGQLKRD